MKRLFLIVFIGLISLSTFAQQFELTPDGLKDANDNSKDFIVLPYEGKTASELYNICKLYVNKTMTDPKSSIIADVDKEYLRYKIFTPEIFSFSKMLTKLQVEAFYQVEMRFRDGRIRYSIENLELTFKEGGKPFYISASKMKGWAFFDNNGKLLMKNEKEKLENYFNEKVKMLNEDIQSEGSGQNGKDNDW